MLSRISDRFGHLELLANGCDSKLYGLVSILLERPEARVTNSDIDDAALVGFLRDHPAIRTRIASMARAVANADGDLLEADAAKERLVEEMRHLGQTALQDWAERLTRNDTGTEVRVIPMISS